MGAQRAHHPRQPKRVVLAVTTRGWVEDDLSLAERPDRALSRLALERLSDAPFERRHLGFDRQQLGLAALEPRGGLFHASELSPVLALLALERLGETLRFRLRTHVEPHEFSGTW
jgi:hypothetical protein